MSNYKIGDIVTCKVTGFEKYGIFVSVDHDFSGLIHISEISDAFVRDIMDYVSLDEVIYAKVLGYDGDHHKLKLSIKNFDYRFNSNQNTVIEENGNGFSELQKALDKWIDIKEKEIEKIEKKP